MSRTTLGIVALVGLTVVVLVGAPFVGAPLDGDAGRFVLTRIRIPRVVLGAVVGAVLGCVGAAFQAIFENPLATPDTTGTTAGAALGALAILMLAPWAATTGTLAVAAGAFAGALAVTAAVTSIAARRRARVEDVLLAGIALTLGAGALTTGLQARADLASTARAVRWSLGSLGIVGWDPVVVLLPLSLACLTVLFSQVRALDALVAGEDVAHTQGVDVVRLRTLVLGAGALGVAACVAWCGPIAFVGLVVPHLVRRTVGASRRVLLPLSAVTGAGFLVLCDTAARVALDTGELPVGVLTAAVGAPVLAALVGRR